MNISYIKHGEVNKNKWDQCINNAHNQLIYAYSYYLDRMSKNWDALVMNDYEAVMPLTWKKKYGIKYLYQPAFTQQLGIFGNCLSAGQTGLFTENITKFFIDKALELFPFIEINLNYNNEYKGSDAKRCNLILPLNRHFSEIEKSFRKDFVNKIKNHNLNYQSSDEFEKAIQLFKKNYAGKLHLSKHDYENWVQVCILLKKRGQLFIREVSSNKGELLSIALFLKDNRRIYYVISATLPQGRKQESNYFLIYNLIKEFSNQNLSFDFEGSEIPSIQSFFKKFGPIEQPYPFVRINNLPFWKKWLKDIMDNFRK